MAVSGNVSLTLENQLTVSVVIPTFNRANLLPRAISSVLAQTFSNFELIIVDDGSTDNTDEVVKNFIDPRIRFLPLGKNCGGSHARNQGIKAARADYIAFLDSDDEWLPRKLELQLARLQSSDNPHATVVYCSGYEYYESIQRKKLPNLIAHEGDVFNHLLRGWLPPTTSLFMIKRSALIDVGGFDERLPSFQDYDLWLSLAQANNHFLTVNEPLIIRYFHNKQIGGNLSANLQGFHIFENKWGSIIKQHLGYKGYRECVGLKTSIIQVNRLGKAVDANNRFLALRYTLSLLQFLPISGTYILTGLILIIFGREGHKNLIKFKDKFYLIAK
ncbi:MAG: glycosyltransferase [Trichormus sp. ATA11-4-KO1]|jgi:glycosyltransferase involved in cell wall biosynthesis|nr:glycosyltransferase [Trichormus sp. ATA11-4-KO1]